MLALLCCRGVRVRSCEPNCVATLGPATGRFETDQRVRRCLLIHGLGVHVRRSASRQTLGELVDREPQRLAAVVTVRKSVELRMDNAEGVQGLVVALCHYPSAITLVHTFPQPAS